MKILLAVDGSPYTKKMLAYLAVHELFSPKNEYTAFTAQMMLPTQARAALGQGTGRQILRGRRPAHLEASPQIPGASRCQGQRHLEDR